MKSTKNKKKSSSSHLSLREARIEQHKQLERSLFDVAISHREDVLNVIKPHTGFFLRNGYGKLMADYREERRKVDYLKQRREEL